MEEERRKGRAEQRKDEGERKEEERKAAQAPEVKPCERSCNFLFGRDVTSCLERHHLPAAATHKRTHASNTKKLGLQLPSCGTRPPEATPACETFTHSSVNASSRTPGSLQVF